LTIIYLLFSSIYGPIASKQLKSNDLFIDHVLTVLNEKSKKRKRMADSIIWKLGDEKIVREEHADKQKQQLTTMNDDQMTNNDQWDDSIPFDLIISYTNNPSDKLVCERMYKRLIAKQYKICFEKEGKHRFELIKKAVNQQKLILVALSSKYRTSKACMSEVEYTFNNASPIIPIIVESKYKPIGWLNHLTHGTNIIDFTQKNFDDSLLRLIEQIEKIKPSE
jgi:hypothetical protein